ncbi:MAG: hypothetical protein E7039_11695 [Lentisphaerae bacterium]|nr:hypothetical protein [Lentisphaerota bacterium]
MVKKVFLLLAATTVFSLAAAEPVNLAWGKKVIYAVAPDNPTDPDCTKLTDGKINLPPQAGKNSANEYFDELRQNYAGGETMSKNLTAGWHWKGSKDTEYGLALAVDLGKAEVLSKVRLRAASFTNYMYRFSLPREVIAVGSMDGKNFYKIGMVAKVTSELAEDFPQDAVPLKVYEKRNQWRTFAIDAEGVEARYVGLIIKPEGFMFYCDEFQVLAGKVRNEARNKKIYTPDNRQRFAIGKGLAPADEVLFCPHDGELVVPEDDFFAPQLLYFRDFRTGKVKKDYTFYMTLPAGVELVQTKLLKEQFTTTVNLNRDQSRTLALTPKNHKYKPHLGKLLAGKQIGPLYFRLAGKLADNASATFAVRAGDKFYTPVTVPVRSLKFPQNTPGKQPFSASITWMPEVYAMDWPDFVNVYRKTGFNGVPIFPYQWHYMKPARGSGFVEESRSFAEKVRKHNMDIIQVESAIHAIVWRGEQPCTYKGAKVFCMSYRGERFQKHLEDLKNASKLIKPAMVIWDIELVGKSFGGNINNILKCDRCSKGVKESGLSVSDYILKCGNDIYSLLRKAHTEGAGHTPKFGQYDVFAGQKELLKHAYHYAWDFDGNYPHTLDLAMPALYTAGLFDVNHNRIRDQYKRLQKNWVVSSWVTPGVYGYCSPKKMEHLVYEHILNGGNIMIYSVYEMRTPRQLYSFAKAFQTLGLYSKLLHEGKVDLDFKVNNNKVAVTRFASEKEALIYIANYSSPERESFELNLPAGSVVAASSSAVSVKTGRNSLQLAPAEFVLIYTPLK